MSKINAAITAVHGKVPEKVLSTLIWKKWLIPTMNGLQLVQELKKEE